MIPPKYNTILSSGLRNQFNRFLSESYQHNYVQHHHSDLFDQLKALNQQQLDILLECTMDNGSGLDVVSHLLESLGSSSPRVQVMLLHILAYIAHRHTPSRTQIFEKHDTLEQLAVLDHQDLANAARAVLSKLELSPPSPVAPRYVFGGQEQYAYHVQLVALLKHAESSIWWCDPYSTDDQLNYIHEYGNSKNIKELRLITGQTSSAANKLFRDVHPAMERFRKQYPNCDVQIRTTNKIHDRFLLINKNKAWSLGSSIEHAGDKATAILEIPHHDLQRSMTIFQTLWEESEIVS